MKANFSDRLKYAMAYNNMTIRELCEKTATSKSAMSAYLSGERAPRSPRVYAMAKALDVSEAWLLGYAGDMARTADQEETDAMAAVVKKISEEKGFRDVVLRISALDPQHFELVRNLVSALPQK